MLHAQPQIRSHDNEYRGQVGKLRRDNLIIMITKIKNSRFDEKIK